MAAYRVKVWIVVEEESETDAAAFVETLLKLNHDLEAHEEVVEVEVDWDSVEEVEA